MHTPSVKIARKVAIFIAGVAVIIIGIILLPLPGPGMLIILGGLIILSTEFDWARKYVDMAKDRLQKLRPKPKSKPESDPDSKHPKN